MKKIGKFILGLVLLCFLSCTDEVEHLDINIESASTKTRAINPIIFDWENADWMPVPPTQTKIPSPWVGQGSIVSTYGIDVVNDRKKSEGWELVYNSFDATSKSNLINPYFILYNKYRGVLRIYMYTTSQFIASSSYIQNGLAIISNKKHSLLNFLGEDIINLDNNKSNFHQIYPTPIDGSLPLASNKWFMMEYELAYDKTINSTPYNNVQLSWTANYFNITKINLGGTIQGSIKSQNTSIGSTSKNFFNSLQSTGVTAGTVALSGVGVDFLNKNTINPETGENKLGIPKEVFKGVLKGAASALSGGTGKLPGAVMNIFNSIIGGSSSSPVLNLTLSADLLLEGSSNNGGAIPSTPISFWVPGTTIPNNAIGYIPLYNKSLGVVNFSTTPTYLLNGVSYAQFFMDGGMYTNLTLNFQTPNYSSYLEINPEVKKIANVSIRKQELLFLSKMNATDEKKLDFRCTGHQSVEKWGKDNLNCYINPKKVSFTHDGSTVLGQYDLAMRFTIDVEPLNGSAPSTLTKTILLKCDPSKVKQETDFGF